MGFCTASSVFAPEADDGSGATASSGSQDVERFGVVGQFQRLTHDHTRGLTAKELVQRTAIDGDLAGALAQEHAGSGGLAAASAVVLSDSHD